MSNTHITEILDNAPFAELSQSELQTIREHVAGCADCARAFAAAQVSALLWKERTGEANERALSANPFFQTRVLAAWREQQSGAWSIRRLWNATGGLVASMVATTAALAVLTFVVPASDTSAQQNVALVPSSAEAVVLNQDQNELTNEQALSAMYYADEGDK
jgi:hypothetical protein